MSHQVPSTDALRSFATLCETFGVSDAAAAGSPTATIRPGLEPRPSVSERDSVEDERLGLATLTLDGDNDGSPSADIQLQGIIGQGGMGVVQSALQRSLQREVAVKQLLPHSTQARHIQGLIREARVTGQLEHPNIVPVHALGLDRLGRPVLVMKRISGTAWSQMIRDPKDPAWESVSVDRLRWHLQILVRVCHAIEFAHDRGVVHRDIKPENVMIGAYGEVYVLDWGIALRLVEDHTADTAKAAGTPAYMAPEQVGGGQITRLTDLYLLGATLHEILTGRPRHAGESVLQVMLAASASAPVEFEVGVPRELAAIAARATAAAPAERHPSVQALREALQNFLEHMTSSELAQTAFERLEALDAQIHGPREPEGAAPSGASRDELYRLFAECRFGFQQALRVWPGNDRAVEGLERALGLVASVELDAHNLRGAEIALAQMRAPAPELRERLEQLGRTAAAGQARLAELESLEAERDPRVSARGRAIFVAGACLLLVTMGFGISLAAQADAMAMTWPPMVAIAGSCYGLFGASMLILRKRVRWTIVNQRAAAVGAAVLASLLLMRLVGWAIGLRIYQEFIVELVIIFVQITYVSISLDRRMLAALPPYALACLPALLWPALIVPAYIVATSTLLLTVAWIWYRGGLPPSPDQGPG